MRYSNDKENVVFTPVRHKILGKTWRNLKIYMIYWDFIHYNISIKIHKEDSLQE